MNLRTAARSTLFLIRGRIEWFARWEDALRQRRRIRLEATLQRVLNEYPTESLRRIDGWAAGGRLRHDWGNCLNAAAVGHRVDGPCAVQAELGVPAVLAEALAWIWDRLGDDDAQSSRIRALTGEILASRDRAARTAMDARTGRPDPARYNPADVESIPVHL